MTMGRSAVLVWLAMALFGGAAWAQSAGEATGVEAGPAAPLEGRPGELLVVPPLANRTAPALLNRVVGEPRVPARAAEVAGSVNVVVPRLHEVSPAPLPPAPPPPPPAVEEGAPFRSRAAVGDPERVRFSFPGEYALRVVGQSDILLSDVPTDREDPAENLLGPRLGDEDPNALGQTFYLLHWLRLRPELGLLGRARLVMQADLLGGHIGGDDTFAVDAARDPRSDQVGVSAEGMRLRWFFLELRSSIGVLRLGQMGSSWGMGLLANDGDRDEGYLFGDTRFGDIVERIVFLTKPFYRLTEHPIRELAFFLGGDIVYDDGIADFVEGDLALQLVFGALWRLDPERALGLYIAYRNQDYADGDELAVTAIDVYGQWSLRLAHQISGYLEGELAGVVGQTNAAPSLAYHEADVRQLGLAVRAGLRFDRVGLDVRVEGGYASGDADNTDDVVGRFTFDPDYRVGLILFQELLGWSTARAATLAGHEELVGQPQDGVDLLATNGSVAGAAYVYPSIGWSPLDWLDVRFAILIAQATSDVVSPFETKRRGRAASFRGGPASSRDLGLEIDLGVFARLDLDYFQIRAGVEGAYCVPGHAFDSAEGARLDEIGLVRGRLQLDW
jgi:hypothetical protein